MKCPKCRSGLPENAVECHRCGYHLESEKAMSSDYVNGDDKSASKPLAGFKRTLSTELVEKQVELRIEEVINDLVENRKYEPGDLIISKGDTNRDLYLLTDGSVEISIEGGDGNLILNEIESPYILGDIAFLSGFPRTATAKAKTEVEIFILKYERLTSLFKEFPDWLRPVLTSFASNIKTLHFRNAELTKEIMESKKNSGESTDRE